MANVRATKAQTAEVLLNAIEAAAADYTDPTSLEQLANAYSLVAAAAPSEPEQATTVY